LHRFLLMLRNGEPADHPAFVTEQADWKPGDLFVAANGRAFRIVDTDTEVEAAGMVLFHATGRWNGSTSSDGRPRRQAA
jgi:hypothetical protein